ncbi:hypothetical protein [Gordonia alkanivorans]|uniref:MarR family transcriptional regulator n=1 Tax=Gordonia alkanivorans NBRC 16433 TaxID=1027371 RepID=F9VU46_9ACTN|nr:hypothetical protein [Gordonia alkanivorans]GAA12135.1 hypothetical protein GOALK_048_00970 [Gordonia alkanivorans NBRC 16433]
MSDSSPTGNSVVSGGVEASSWYLGVDRLVEIYDTAKTDVLHTLESTGGRGCRIEELVLKIDCDEELADRTFVTLNAVESLEEMGLVEVVLEEATFRVIASVAK